MAANALEEAHVLKVYSAIASSFSSTRFSAWGSVQQFLTHLPLNSFVLDAGCGNGKYLRFPRTDLHWCAMDVCAELLNIAANRNHSASADADFIQTNILKLPFRDGQFDAIISIAVLHHISTPERRAQCVKELLRVLRPGGQLFLTVWAAEQQHSRKANWEIQANHDAYIPWNHGPTRYYHLFPKEEIAALFPNGDAILTYDRDNWTALAFKSLSSPLV